jgi:hypothetical protein
MKPTIGYTKYGGNGTRHNAIECFHGMKKLTKYVNDGQLEKGIQQEVT